MRGWNRNINACYRELKKKILSKLDKIDKQCEIYGLTAADRVEQMEHMAQLDRLLRQEEAKLKQRAKIDEILIGNCNTKYFHAKANGRHRRNKITISDQDKGRIEGDKQLLDYITSFYKNLFGHPEVSHISLNIDDPAIVPLLAKEALISEFSLDEIKKAVFQMAHNKSPGPDGFSLNFINTSEN